MRPQFLYEREIVTPLGQRFKLCLNIPPGEAYRILALDAYRRLNQPTRKPRFLSRIGRQSGASRETEHV